MAKCVLKVMVSHTKALQRIALIYGFAFGPILLSFTAQHKGGQFVAKFFHNQ